MYGKAVQAMPDSAGCLRILVVAHSAALRLRIRQLLGAEPTAALLDQTGDTAEGVRLAQRLQPHLILCDAAVAADPALFALFAGSAGRPAPKLVLLDDDAAQRKRSYPVPLAALLPADLPAHELVAYLSTMIDLPQAADIGTPLRSEPAARPHMPQIAARRRATDHGWSPTSGAHEPAPHHNRTATPPPVPPIAGPLDQQALELAAQALMRALYPVSMLVVELCYVPGSVTPTDTSTCMQLSQRLEATLRQTVRRDDLVCALESLTSAALLPGLLREQQGLIRNRLADAIQNAGFDHLEDGLQMAPAIGIVSWEPGQEEIDLLREARAAGSAARALLLRRRQPVAAW